MDGATAGVGSLSGGLYGFVSGDSSAAGSSAATVPVTASLVGRVATASSPEDIWNQVLEDGLSAADVMRLLLAVATGKTTITDLGGGLATVRFRDAADTKDRVVAGMTDSERTSVTTDGT